MAQTRKPELIYVVEDEAAIARLIADTLEKFSYRTELFRTAEAFFHGLRHQVPDLVVLDLGLPDMDGMAVLQQLRRKHTCGLLVVTGRADTHDRVMGLELGADDYVVKPFSPREVAARVKAILKRMAPRPTIDGSSALFRIDPERVQISYRGQTLNLTRHEFRLLQCLLEQPQRVFSREQLLDALGVAADAGYERSIDSHIKSVRAKLRLVRADAEPIQTHRGLGYSYSPGHS